MELSFRRPDVIFNLTSEERKARCKENDDICILDGERFFVEVCSRCQSAKEIIRIPRVSGRKLIVNHFKESGISGMTRTKAKSHPWRGRSQMQSRRSFTRSGSEFSLNYRARKQGPVSRLRTANISSMRNSEKEFLNTGRMSTAAIFVKNGHLTSGSWRRRGQCAMFPVTFVAGAARPSHSRYRRSEQNDD